MSLKKINNADRDLQLIQANVDEALSPLQAMPMVGANVLTGIQVGTSQTAIPHLLGKTPRYWSALDVFGNGRVYRSAASDDKYIYLTAIANAVTITLWIA